jgi:hypothetical protein
LACVLAYPFDTVTKHLVVDSGEQTKRYSKGKMDCFEKIAKTEGIRGFYHGISPKLVMSTG